MPTVEPFMYTEPFPTSSWFFLRKTNSSVRPSICISRSQRVMVISSSTLRRPLMSASKHSRRHSSCSYLQQVAGRQVRGWDSEHLSFTTLGQVFTLEQCSSFFFFFPCQTQSSWPLLASVLTVGAPVPCPPLTILISENG